MPPHRLESCRQLKQAPGISRLRRSCRPCEGRGIALAFAIVPLRAATYANITPADTGRATAINSTQAQVSAALGVAALATVLVTGIHAATARATSPGALAHGALTGYHLAFIAGAVLIALAALSGLLIRDQDAAATMRPCAPKEAPGRGQKNAVHGGNPVARH